jgi:hypothetical protein
VLVAVATLFGADIYGWIKARMQGKPAFAVVGPGAESDQGYVDWAPALGAIRKYLNSNPRPKILDRLKDDEKSDNGDSKLAEQVAEELCTNPKIVAVIGYVWSSVAKPALEVYGGPKCIGGPLPVILVGATADGLTQANEEKWTLPVLQMAPSNALQARAIAEALGDTYSSRESPRVLQFLDKDNLTYARPLAEQIRNAVREYKKAPPRWKSVDYDDETWRGLRSRSEDFDVVIFVGNSRSAARFLRELPTKGTRPVVIVTDGSVNDSLLSVPQAECIWGTFPATAGDGARSPDFSDFGLNAIRLLQSMALRVESPVTRGALSGEFERLVRSNRPELVDGRRFLFDYRGRIADYSPDKSEFFSTLYHFHRVQRDEKGALRWAHRERRDSLDSPCGSGG